MELTGSIGYQNTSCVPVTCDECNQAVSLDVTTPEWKSRAIPPKPAPLEPITINRRTGKITPRHRGFTLIELLVVILIILIASAVALPSIVGALSHRQVSEGARQLQAALAGSRDAAIRDNAPRGIRLLPDPAFPITYLTNGQIDPSQPLAANRILPIGSAPDYSEGLLTTWQGPLPANVTALPCVMAYESPVDSQGLLASRWWWNARVGDKLQINKAGPLYTVVGPVVIANPEQFVNIGAPGADPTTLTQALKVNGIYVDYLLLVNGKDDNANGWIDEGFDGVDNNGINGIDEAAEWEQEAWIGPLASKPLSAVSYVLKRRPAPMGAAREINLPTNVVIDLTTWGTTKERSRLPVNLSTGYVDVVLNPNGTVVPTTLYSTPASIGMSGAFYHFWVAERSDVFAPSPWYHLCCPCRHHLLIRNRTRFNGAAVKGEYRDC